MGYTIPVGPKCDGAFGGTHSTAAGADIAFAMRNGYSSHLADACRAAAPGQMGIYFGIIGFGVAIVILGIVLRSTRRAGAQPVAAPTYSVANGLERLVRLRDQGVLSDEQFEHQKQVLLKN